MPLDPEEILELSDEVIALYCVLEDALKPDATGKRKITRKERRKILLAVSKLQLQLAQDLID